MDLLTLLIVLHNKLLLRRSQSIATARIRRLGILHAKLHVSRQRSSVPLLFIVEQTRTTHPIVQTSPHNGYGNSKRP